MNMPVENDQIKKLDHILEHIERGVADRKELMDQMSALNGRMDAMEGRKEQEVVDAAKEAAVMKADAESKTATEADRAKFADAQMRADAAYQAWGKQAPNALHGEALRDFRIRLLGPLKQHSSVYKDSALNLVGDDSAFDVIERAIVDSAVKASTTTYTAAAPLRKVVKRQDSGHVITEWIGDPAVGWAQFMGGATRFVKINAPKPH